MWGSIFKILNPNPQTVVGHKTKHSVPRSSATERPQQKDEPQDGTGNNKIFEEIKELTCEVCQARGSLAIPLNARGGVAICEN